MRTKLPNLLKSSLKTLLKSVAIVAGIALSHSTIAQNEFITKWDPGVTAPGTTQLIFGVETSGIVSYTWQTDPLQTSGSGTFTGTNVTIAGLPTNKKILVKINPINFKSFNLTNGIYNNKIETVEQWGTVTWSGMSSMFRDCSNLQIAATDVPNLTNVRNMNSMFANCTVLDSPNNMNNTCKKPPHFYKFIHIIL